MRSSGRRVSQTSDRSGMEYQGCSAAGLIMFNLAEKHDVVTDVDGAHLTAFETRDRINEHRRSGDAVGEFDVGKLVLGRCRELARQVLLRRAQYVHSEVRAVGE